MHFFVLGSFRFLLHQQKIKGTKEKEIKVLENKILEYLFPRKSREQEKHYFFVRLKFWCCEGTTPYNFLPYQSSIHTKIMVTEKTYLS